MHLKVITSPSDLSGGSGGFSCNCEFSFRLLLPMDFILSVKAQGKSAPANLSPASAAVTPKSTYGSVLVFFLFCGDGNRLTKSNLGEQRVLFILQVIVYH